MICRICIKYKSEIIFFLLIFIFISNKITAQADSIDFKTQKTIAFNLGVTDFHVRDELATPLTYRSLGLAGGLSFTIKGNSYIHNISLEGYYSKLKTVYDKYDALNGRAGIRYNYLHKIPVFNKTKNINIYAGGGLYSFINFSHYEEHLSFGDETVADVWYLSHTAEISLLLCYRYNPENNFAFQLHFPLLANVSRPPYSADVTTDKNIAFKLFGKMSPFWENLIVQIKLGYTYTLQKWLEFTAKYDFQFSTYPEPRNVVMYMNNFKIGLNFLL